MKKRDDFDDDRAARRQVNGFAVNACERAGVRVCVCNECAVGCLTG